jgi:hypothetical protein
MTAAEILAAFDLAEDPRPDQEAIARYLAACTQVEMAVDSLAEHRFQTAQQVLKFLENARSQKARKE